jgi:expansin (peptidoglycan-binding protein)
LSQSSKATPSSTAVASPISPTATTSAGSSFATPSSFASQTTVSVKPSAVISSTPSAASTTAKMTTATSTSTSSSAAPTSTGTGYVGCYFNLTPLISLAYTSSVNTNALCRATCYGKGYAYAGTTGGLQVRVPRSPRDEACTDLYLQCSCAHSLGLAFQAPALTCNLPCSGDWSQACGGPGSVSVYKTH